MHVQKERKTIIVDIHGLRVEDAKRRLEHIIGSAPQDTEEVRVIHGYNSGQALRDMVRHKLKHPRISAKLLTLNPGETRIVLCKPSSAGPSRRK